MGDKQYTHEELKNLAVEWLKSLGFSECTDPDASHFFSFKSEWYRDKPPNNLPKGIIKECWVPRTDRFYRYLQIELEQRFKHLQKLISDSQDILAKTDWHHIIKFGKVRNHFSEFKEDTKTINELLRSVGFRRIDVVGIGAKNIAVECGDGDYKLTDFPDWFDEVYRIPYPEDQDSEVRIEWIGSYTKG